ncbi:MAG: hypothetical protein Q7K42_05965, partial [Candidatus Diapherotrites archaeon]|nr:hypothetical protein [Candidatus Diapherotrites archaeon]
MKKLQRVFLISIFLILLVLFSGCTRKIGNSDETPEENSGPSANIFDELKQPTLPEINTTQNTGLDTNPKDTPETQPRPEKIDSTSSNSNLQFPDCSVVDPQNNRRFFVKQPQQPLVVEQTTPDGKFTLTMNLTPTPDSSEGKFKVDAKISENVIAQASAPEKFGKALFDELPGTSGGVFTVEFPFQEINPDTECFEWAKEIKNSNTEGAINLDLQINGESVEVNTFKLKKQEENFENEN